MSSLNLNSNEKRALTSVVNLIKDDKGEQKFILVTQSDIFFNEVRYTKEENGSWKVNNETGIEFFGLTPVSKLQGL